MSTLDYVTAFLVLIVAVLVVAGSYAVVRFYAVATRRAPRRYGLLLWHVVAVAAATCWTWGMLALGQLDILGLVETPRWARLIGYAIGGLLTLTSLVLIGVVTQRRVRVIPPATPVIHIDDGPPPRPEEPTDAG